jgi:hypothetical protein
MYPELANSFANWRSIAHITRFQADDACVDAKASLIVLETIEPVREGL